MVTRIRVKTAQLPFVFPKMADIKATDARVSSPKIAWFQDPLDYPRRTTQPWIRSNAQYNHRTCASFRYRQHHDADPVDPDELPVGAECMCGIGRRETLPFMGEATDATLTKTEKNRILKLIVEYGPPSSDFLWTETEQEEYYSMSNWPYRVSVLTHRPTGYYCVFGAHSITACPGITKKVEEFHHDDLWEWKENACGKWLIILKIEVDAPDLWASIAQENVLPVAARSTTDNRLFTPAERNLIRSELDEIKAYLQDGRDFNAEQSEMIEREFAYLRESSERLGRKDWLNNLLVARWVSPLGWRSILKKQEAYSD
jgi:hypothetical protein